METMYPGKVNSPATVLDGAIDDVVTTINVIDGSVLPNAPNIAVIGTGEDAETILYGTKVENALSNVTRGFQGTAKAWNSGTSIARMFTEYDYAKLKQNIENLKFLELTDTPDAYDNGKFAKSTTDGVVWDTPAQQITSKSTTATLTTGEAGVILVSAVAGYTLTLPTAVGNSGLQYTIKKTDANTNLITIDADGSEKIDGAEIYTELNYQYAYVTIVSDNSNWCIIGQSTVKGGTF